MVQIWIPSVNDIEDNRFQINEEFAIKTDAKSVC